jgi:hypothetical protein
MSDTVEASLGLATPYATRHAYGTGGTRTLPRSTPNAARCLVTRLRDLPTSVAVVAVVANLATACADAPTGTRTAQSADRGLDGANATLTSTHALKPAGELFGAVALKSSPDRTLLFMSVDQPRDGAKPDGVADAVFTLQLEQPLALPIFYPLADARVSYSRRHVVATNGQQTLRLDLDERPLHSTRTASSTGDGQQFRWSGYGLSRRAGQWRLASGALSSGTIDQFTNPTCDLRLRGLFTTSTTGAPAMVGPLDLQPCQAGGYGSSGCSIYCYPPDPTPPPGWVHSCSTSCGPGYYACCNCFDDGARCLCARCPPRAC